MYPRPFFAIFLLAALFNAATSIAQTAFSAREVGLQFNGINLSSDNSFSFFYKKAVSVNRFCRMRATFSTLDISHFEGRTEAVADGGFSYGIEKRTGIGDKLNFYRGWELGVNAGFASENQGIFRWIAGVSIGYVIGLQHEFNERWALNLETVPRLAATVRKKDGESAFINLSAGFSSLASLGIVRKF